MRATPSRVVTIASAALAAALAGPAAHAATPPAQVNYQGVLRDAADRPLNGTFDMTLSLWDAASAGNQVLVDAHSGADGVIVSGGLFSTTLGGGVVSDGPGPGTYTSLADVFRDHQNVWLEVKVATETLAPRTPIAAAAYALNATNLGGRAPAAFLDTSSTAQTKTGTATFDATLQANSSGLEAYGTLTGGHFKTGGAGELFAGHGDTGVDAYGTYAGGIFRHGTTAAYDMEAVLADGTDGLRARAPISAAYFTLNDGTAYAHIAYNYTFLGQRYGISTYGTTAGVDASATGTGVRGSGMFAGGSFSNSGAAATGTSTLGLVNTGLSAVGTYSGCDWCDGAVVARDAFYSGHAILADGDVGILGQGSYEGAEFRHGSVIPGYDVRVGLAAGGGVGLSTNGSKNFVQNHPYASDRSINYSSLEGDEVGVYTRGSGRLDHGRATVRLGETFEWVANPDVGLTATVTARGAAPLPLAVENVTTRELTVVGPPDSNAAFDYAVFGLRIGFEEAGIVGERLADAPLPSFDDYAAQRARHPDLAAFTPLARFRTQATAAGRTVPSRMPGAEALVAAIGAHGAGPAPPMRARLLTPEHEAAFASAPHAAPPASVMPIVRAAPEAIVARAGDAAAPVAPGTLVDVSETVTAGDLLVVDPDRAGSCARARSAADPGVVGIVLDDAERNGSGQALMAVAGTIVPCHVDATRAPINVGDLLVSSDLPGHAAPAGPAARQGTVVAKALEPLAGGTGTIRVLAMSR